MKEGDFMKNGLCVFATDNVSKQCQILVGTSCNGTNKFCSFFKSEGQYQQELDRAILVNRKKGNCDKCKYGCIPCKLSSEGIGGDADA